VISQTYNPVIKGTVFDESKNSLQGACQPQKISQNSKNKFGDIL